MGPKVVRVLRGPEETRTRMISWPCGCARAFFLKGINSIQQFVVRFVAKRTLAGQELLVKQLNNVE